MSTSHLPNGSRGQDGSSSQPADRTYAELPHPRVDILNRQNKVAVGPEKSKFWDQRSGDPKTREEVIKRFRSAMDRWHILEKYDLIYKYKSISPNQVRLLYIYPAARHENNIIVSLETLSDEQLGSAEHQQPYEALSYHWGPGPADKPIYFSGLNSTAQINVKDLVTLQIQISRIAPDYEQGKRFYVRPNLDKALRYLRHKKKMVVLWVDAICIDQSDEIKEKPAQIAKMKHIYNKASNVCIWLGDGKSDKDEDRSEDFNNAMEFSRTILSLKNFEKLLNQEYSKSWSDLLDLMRCTWFSRRWVIQEIALAREATVHCGTQCVSWQDFADAIGLFDLNFDTIRELFAHSQHHNAIQNYKNFNELEPLGAKVLVDAVTNTFRKNADGTVFEPVFDLETLVTSLASFESSDPRDSIFALLNIARESILTLKGGEAVKPPKPDYEKDLLEVYTDLLEWVVYSTGSLDMICRQWATSERTKPGGRKNPTSLVTLPSWIQTIQKSTWGTQQQGFNGRMNGDSLVGKAGRRRYNASRGKRPEIQFGLREQRPKRRESEPIRPRPNKGGAPLDSLALSVAATLPISFKDPPKRTPSHRLHARGVTIGEVKWTSGPVSRGIITKASFERGGWTFDGELKDKVPDKLWRTMIADRDADGNNTPAWYHRAALHSMALVDNNNNLPTQELLNEIHIVPGQKHPRIVTEFLKRVQGVIWNRAFIEAEHSSRKPNETEPLFGIGSPETGPGDIICILFGCSVPCILKHHVVEGKSVYFEFIGEAYVYGRMDGEGISMLDDELMKETRDFVII